VPHQPLGHVPGRRDEHESSQPFEPLLSLKLPNKEEGDPSTHRRAHHDRAPVFQQLKHGAGLFQPVADRSLEQIAIRQPMSRIVEAQHRYGMSPRPVGESERFGALHVGKEAWNPQKGWTVPIAHIGKAKGNAPPSVLPHLQELRFLVVHPKKLHTLQRKPMKSRAWPK
jgi:hypothetical protein